MQKFRFHSLAVPHTVSNKEYNGCAFTQKIIKFSEMMLPRGHEIFHYGHEDSDVLCTEHISVTNNDILKEAYGNYDWRRFGFQSNVSDYANQQFIEKTIPELLKRVKKNDFILCWWGIGHQAIAEEAEKLGAIAVEPGIGYDYGHFAKWRAYESHSIRTLVEGSLNPQNWYSWVIPNYFNPNDFDYKEKKSDYFLYLGRIIESKGLPIAIQATKCAGVKLKIAGQGSLMDLGYYEIPDHCEEVGYADIQMRKQLMSEAQGLIIGSYYLEPFGGVQVESLLSGTPVIAPFYGAFAEILEHQKTGFLCHTLKEFIEGIDSAFTINPRDCRQSGMRYSLDNVAPQFENWFSAIWDVYNKDGWITI